MATGNLRLMSEADAAAARDSGAVAYIVSIDYGYEGWSEPLAVCESRAAALAYIGTQAGTAYCGSWQITVLPVLTLAQVAEPKPEAA